VKKCRKLILLVTSELEYRQVLEDNLDFEDLDVDDDETNYDYSDMSDYNI
jgi:hypothetical protein